jgi:hypothetical protein
MASSSGHRASRKGWPGILNDEMTHGIWPSQGCDLHSQWGPWVSWVLSWLLLDVARLRVTTSGNNLFGHCRAVNWKFYLSTRPIVLGDIKIFWAWTQRLGNGRRSCWM